MVAQNAGEESLPRYGRTKRLLTPEFWLLAPSPGTP
jgi:hypothetical protein